MRGDTKKKKKNKTADGAKDLFLAARQASKHEAHEVSVSSSCPYTSGPNTDKIDEEDNLSEKISTAILSGHLYTLGCPWHCH